MNELSTDEDLAKALEAQPAFLFKHSTTCPISARAHQRVTEWLGTAPDSAPPIHLVKVIEARPLSNAIAERVGVTHASPQLMLIAEGKAVWDASHGMIDDVSIEEAIDEFVKS